VSAVRYLLRTWGRPRLFAIVAVGLLAAISMGVVLLAGLGAVRARGGWDDLHVRSRGEDVLVDVSSIDTARRLAVEAADVDGVESAAAIAYGYLVPEGRREDFFGGVILPLGPGLLDTVWRSVVIDGRLPRQDRIGEAIVNEDFVAITGLEVGADFVLTDPVGLIRQPITIVGVGVQPIDFTYGADSPLAYLTQAFTQEWDSQLQQLEERSDTEVVPGVTAIASEGVTTDDLVDRLLRALPSEELRDLNSAATVGALVDDTLGLQRNGYVVLAAASGLGALALLALLIAAVTRVTPSEALTLRAVGFSRRDFARVVAVPGVAIIVIGIAGALLVVAIGSGAVPTGLAARVGADRQLGDDLPYLVVCGSLVALALSSLVVATAIRAMRVALPQAMPPTPRLGLIGPPAIAVGLRQAAGGLARSSRRRAVAAVLAIVVAVTGISAVTVLLRSRDDLLADPSRVGKVFDVYLYTYTNPAAADADRAALADSTKVEDVAIIEAFTLGVEGRAVPASTIAASSGGLAAPVVEGRLPMSPDEVALSVPFLRRSDRRVGETLEISGPAGARRARIVGTAVLPFLSTTAAGEQLVLTSAGREALGAEPEGYAVVADLKDPSGARSFRARDDEVEACDTARLLELVGVGQLEGPTSGEVSFCVPRGDPRSSSLREFGALPGVIIGFLGVLGVSALALLLGALRGTRRDLSMLRAVGFTPRQAAAAVCVHAGVIPLVGALLALPLGIALGRVAWRGLAETLGIVTRPEVPIPGTIGLIVATLLVAELLAALFTRLAVTRSVAAQLRASLPHSE
jgi:hypothetical protein